MSVIEGILTVHKGSYFEGIIHTVKLSAVGGHSVSMNPDEFVEVGLAGQKLEVTFKKSPSLTKIFIGKKLLVNCTSFDVHMDVKSPSIFRLEVIGLPTFSNKNSKMSRPFIFR